MIIDDDPFQVLSEKDPTKLPGVNSVWTMSSGTGKFMKLAELEHHLGRGKTGHCHRTDQRLSGEYGCA
jgi:hypothetical protein